jgi:hypothetical protein
VVGEEERTFEDGGGIPEASRTRHLHGSLERGVIDRLSEVLLD